MADLEGIIRDELTERFYSEAEAAHAADKYANVIRAVLDLSGPDIISDRRAWQLAYDIRRAIADALALVPSSVPACSHNRGFCGLSSCKGGTDND
jgi:hypothetical protein